MSKYARLARQAPPPPRPWKVHPIWRGIGCMLLLVGPVLAYIGANLLVEANRQQKWLPAPAELMRPIRLPLLNLTIDHLVANLLVTGILLLIGFGLITIIYTIFYSLLGPPRYGPLDSPPVRLPHRRRR